MKPHLPLSLLFALVPLAVSGVHGVEVPSGYNTHYLDQASDLSAYSSSTGKEAFLLDGSVTFSSSSAGWWTSSTPLKSGGSVLFTIEEDGDPYSLVFSGGKSSAFCKTSLSIADIGHVKFENIVDDDYDYISSFVNQSLYYYHNYGGAVYASTLSLQGNRSVSFCGNQAISSRVSGSSGSGYYRYYASGGAIYGSTVEISGTKGAVNFSQNTSSSDGGAIYGASNSTITLSNNGEVSFSGNSAYYRGGAIYGDDYSSITLSDNGKVSFSGNTAEDSGGAIYGYSNSTITLRNNGEVSFTGNTATSYGGAIYGYSTTTLSNNGTVTFTGNTASSYGGAIYTRSLSIRNNESVEFAGNVEESGSTYRLRSIYVKGGSEDTVSFSAAEGKSIIFRDSIYIGAGTTVNFNADYTDAEGNTIAQKGDIVFDGKDVVSTLESIKGMAATEDEITHSLISYVGGAATLEGGRLILRNGVQYEGVGLNTTARSGAAVVMEDASMNHTGGGVNIKRGTTLELSGRNEIKASMLSLSSGSTLRMAVSGEAREQAVLNVDAVLEHFSVNIALEGEGMLASGRYKLVELAEASQYSDEDGYWNADDISVSAAGDAAGLGFADLLWEDGVLYVEQVRSEWTNAGGDGVWNAEAENWQRHEHVMAYKDGMDVLFKGKGCGTVQLEGVLTPLSVTVDNAAGQDYVFAGEGALSGGSGIVKMGAGELSLATANEYTGGTVLNEGTLRVQHSSALGDSSASVTAAAGTLLSIENQAAVVLSAAEGNCLAGCVQVAAGASLEMLGSGYRAEETKLDGELVLSGSRVVHNGAGSLSGKGHLRLSGENSEMHLQRLDAFAGSLTVQGGSSLSVQAGNYAGGGAITVTGAGTSMDLGAAGVDLSAGGHLSVADGAEFAAATLKVGEGAELQALAAGASLGLGEVLPSNTVVMHTQRLEAPGALDAALVLNSNAAGALRLEGGLTLEGRGSYHAVGSHVHLGGSTLTLNSGVEAGDLIRLTLSLDGTYTPHASQVVLFSGVSAMGIGGVLYGGDCAMHVFYAGDYMQGDYIGTESALVYDSAQGVVYLTDAVEAVPEPSTATLSLLALAALASRRRRE